MKRVQKVWYRHSKPLPSCKVESLETRIVNVHVFMYRLWYLRLHWNIIAYFYIFCDFPVTRGSSKCGYLARGWLVFNCLFFRFGGRNCTQILSGLKKLFFLYYSHFYFYFFIRSIPHTSLILCSPIRCSLSAWTYHIITPGFGDSIKTRLPFELKF